MPESGSGQGQFVIHKVYVKDLSFEAPNSPSVFRSDWRPDVDLNLDNQATGYEDHTYEVVLTLTVTVRLGERTAYLVEVQQSGLFHLSGFSDEDMGPMLGSFCPNILFPYAREAVSDLVTRGGFPQLLLAPVNFDALYAKHLQDQAEGAAGSSVN